MKGRGACARRGAYAHTSPAMSTVHAQLRPLLVLGQHIAFLGRGEAALRRQRELIRRHVFGGLADAALDVGLVFQGAEFGGDQAEHHDLGTGGQESQRLESAGALAVIFEEIAVVIAVCEQAFRHRLVAAGRNPGRAEIAAAHMGGDCHVGGLGPERLVDGAGVALLQVIDVDAALARLFEFLLRNTDRPRRCRRTAGSGSRRVESAHRVR